MIYRRKEFSKETKRAAFARSGGICECHLIPHVFEVACGRPLVDGQIFFEHINPDRVGGLNDIDNAATLTKTCFKYKTAHYDQPIIARVRKREDRSRGIRNAPSMPGSRLDPFKIKVARRQVVDRTSGEPWRGR